MGRSGLRDALALFSPVQCCGCGVPDVALCEECAHALHARPRRVQLGGEDGVLPVWASGDYEATLRRVLLAFKDAGRTDAAPALARLLRASIVRALAEARQESPVHLVSIPSTRAAFRSRGYRPVPLLLGRIGLRGEKVVRAVRQTIDQAGLDAVARSANRADSLRVDGRLDGTEWLIVDDILTTGATLLEAARAIRAAGGMPIAAAVVARTPRRLGPS